MQTHEKEHLSHTAILLINTGSPIELTKQSVRSYLNSFLTDRRVVSIWAPTRYLLVRGFITPFRAGKSLGKYKHVWTNEGPLLRIYTQRLAKQLEQLTKRPVVYAMRYEKGSVDKALSQLAMMEDVERVVVLPLFPHFAKSSYESSCDYVCQCYNKLPNKPFALLGVRPYYDHPAFIELLAGKIAQNVDQGAHLIFSYHGLPLRHVQQYAEMPEKDYYQQCKRTSALVLNHPKVSALGLTSENAFQSRLGPHKWLSPATAQRLQELPNEDKTKVTVVCPSFICDCLETIEEIGVEGFKTFTSHGGKEFSLLPCPNDAEGSAEMLLQVLNDNLSPIEYWCDGKKVLK